MARLSANKMVENDLRQRIIDLEHALAIIGDVLADDTLPLKGRIDQAAGIVRMYVSKQTSGDIVMVSL